MNVYILTVDGDRDSFVQVLDQTPMVRNWLAFLPTAVALVTYRPLVDISTYLRDQLPNRQHILVPATSLTSAGMLPANVWDFINKPIDSGKHAPDYSAYVNALAGTTGSANSALSTLRYPTTPAPASGNTLLTGLHRPVTPPPPAGNTLLTGLPNKLAPDPSPKSSLRRPSDRMNPDKK